MAKQDIDIGVEGNDGTGDSIRESFKKVNENFTEVYAIFGLGGTISFKNLDDTPSQYTGNESSVPLVNTGGTGIRFYKFVSDSGTNNNAVSNPSNTTNSVFVEYTDPDPTTPDVSGSVKIIVNDPHIERDPDPRLLKPLSMEAGAAYSNATNTILRNTGSGDNINTLVSDWNTLHSSLPSVTSANLLVSKGYADDTYLNADGDQVTDYLEYNTGLAPAGGRQLPAMEDVIARNGSQENRTMLNDLFLTDHPEPLQGAGTPNDKSDLQVPSKLYVDTQSYASPTNVYVSTKGDDKQTYTPAGKEGRSWSYAFKTVNAAMVKAEKQIKSTPYEAGPYAQDISHTSGTINSVTSTVEGVASPVATSNLADAIVDAQATQIAFDTTDYLNTTYPVSYTHLTLPTTPYV